MAAIGHDYDSVITKPTCTAGGYTTHTCANCGDSYVDSNTAATGHSYGAWKVRRQATCTEAGEEYQKCACGAERIRPIPAKGHAYETVVTAPTCTEAGYTTHTCANCDDSYVDGNTAATGHSFGAWQVRTAATCTENGLEFQTCANCDTEQTRQINAIGHVYESVVTEPTCTETGYTTHTCANCGDSYVDSNTAATGHSFGAWHVRTAATCTENGLEFQTCANCDTEQTRQINAIGHVYESVVTEPTCTETGYTTHTCANCDDSYVDSNTAATGHSFGAWQVRVEATCIKSGEEFCVCAACGAESTRAIAAMGHDYQSVVTAPTCTAQGYTTYTCVKCASSYVDHYMAIIGHSYGAWQVRVEATCTKTGEEFRACTACGAEQMRIVVAKGHDYTSVVTAPTCTVQGYTTHTCNGCGIRYVDNYTAAAGHSFGAWETGKEASCTESGETHRTCTACGLEESRTVSATGHDYRAVVTAPTCTAQGYTTYTCANCGGNYLDQYTAAMGHDWDDGVVTKEPTEQSSGERVRACRRCGETRVEIIPTLDHVHSYEAAVTAPTCTEQGYTTYSCSCGDRYITAYVSAQGHIYGQWYTEMEATCIRNGQQRRDCQNCKHYETKVIETTAHDYVQNVTAPTCTAQGYVTNCCKNCNDSYLDQYTAALGHSFGEWEDMDTTMHYRICTRCATEETAAHGWDAGVVTREATCQEEGICLYTCLTCATTKEESIEKVTTHTYDGTWSSDASGHWHACTLCGARQNVSEHVSSGEATEETDEICVACGYVIQAALGHEHDFGSDWIKDENGHWKACAGCGEVQQYAGHAFENACDADCAVCGYERAIEHQLNEQWKQDPNHHWRECGICGCVLEKVNHVPGAEATATEPQLCTVCGYELVPALGEEDVPPTSQPAQTEPVPGETTPDETVRPSATVRPSEVEKTDDNTENGGTFLGGVIVGVLAAVAIVVVAMLLWTRKRKP